MARPKNSMRWLGAAWFVLGAATAATAQVPGSATPLVGACHVSPIVENLDRSARFYHDLLGLDLVPAAPVVPGGRCHGTPIRDTSIFTGCPRLASGSSAPGCRTSAVASSSSSSSTSIGTRCIAASRIQGRRRSSCSFATSTAAFAPLEEGRRSRGHHGRRPDQHERHEQDARGHRAGSRRPFRRARAEWIRCQRRPWRPAATSSASVSG